MRDPADHVESIGTPWRFGPLLGELDLHLIGEGKHFDLYRKLGAHPLTVAGVAGVNFALWAPNAARVSVVGDFNDWESRRTPMRRRDESGVWETFAPGVGRGALYKFEIEPNAGRAPFWKADPFAFRCELPPATASIVEGLARDRSNADGKRRARLNDRSAPISIYEVHLGSWKRRAGDNRVLTYDELADELIPYAREMQFTHLQLLPIMEHPFGGSWGYLPLSLFAPTSRHGTPAAFRRFVDRCHQAKLGVILDWVPAHFPDDAHGLALMDGTPLYEYADERLGRHRDWGSLIYNYGRPEVANFLIASALFWFDQFDIDGLRVDAVTSMLYRDYNRAEGEWTPNEFGGRENLDAVEFLRRLNDAVLKRFPGAMMVAEESTAWPKVTAPTADGGLGFSYKWNMGWANDTLRYVSREADQREHHHGEITFGLHYAFRENYVLPLSHDEVVHEKRPLIRKPPGHERQRFATLRAYLAFMFAHPGKKLMFMGNEFGHLAEWDHDTGLAWSLLTQPLHLRLGLLVRNLNTLYRGTPALHELDCDKSGFTWLDGNDNNARVVSFIRQSARTHEDFVIGIGNFTTVAHNAYRVGVPSRGPYREILNTDSAFYGGSDIVNDGLLEAEPNLSHDCPYTLELVVPPLATLWLSSANAVAAAIGWTKGQ